MSADPQNLDQETQVVPISSAAAEPPSKAKSLLEQLKQQRRRGPSERRAWLTIPETEGMLVAKYRWLDPVEEGEPIVKRNQLPGRSNADLTLAIAMDTLIESCDGFYLRDSDGELVLIDEDGRGPCRYDHRLADALELDLGEKPRAREVVRAVFSGNTNAIIDHFMRLDRWSRDTTQEADREFWGLG